MDYSLDDLQQDIYKSGGAVEAMVDMALWAIDNSQTLAPSEADHISNLLIGLKTYINQAQDYLGDRIEGMIKEGNSRSELKFVLDFDEEGKTLAPKALSDLLSSPLTR
jgi:hypothetical protein